MLDRTAELRVSAAHGLECGLYGSTQRPIVWHPSLYVFIFRVIFRKSYNFLPSTTRIPFFLAFLQEITMQIDTAMGKMNSGEMVMLFGIFMELTEQEAICISSMGEIHRNFFPSHNFTFWCITFINKYRIFRNWLQYSGPAPVELQEAYEKQKADVRAHLDDRRSNMLPYSCAPSSSFGN